MSDKTTLAGKPDIERHEQCGGYLPGQRQHIQDRGLEQGAAIRGAQQPEQQRQRREHGRHLRKPGLLQMRQYHVEVHLHAFNGRAKGLAIIFARTLPIAAK